MHSLRLRKDSESVLIKHVEQQEETLGMIILTDESKEKIPVLGEVVAVSENCYVRPGDQVLFNFREGEKFKIEGESHVILKEKEILAIV